MLHWMYSFLDELGNYVRVMSFQYHPSPDSDWDGKFANLTPSGTVVTNVGVPQGKVLDSSFTLYIADFKYKSLMPHSDWGTCKKGPAEEYRDLTSALPAD